MPQIAIHNLTKHYQGARDAALQGINLHIEKGELLGLLGPNGAGKTTLISLLCGLIAPTSGTISINDLDLRKNLLRIKQHIGLVPQEIALYPTLTVFQNLDFFCRMYGLSGRESAKRIAYCLDLVDLARYAHKKVASFSGGMKRRANLVAGLLHDPEVIILDEPTVGIDAQSRNAIFENLRHLNQAGKTIIYATHYMEEAEQLCTRAAIIDKGQILTTGSPQQLIAQRPECTSLEQLFLEITGRQLRDNQ